MHRGFQIKELSKDFGVSYAVRGRQIMQQQLTSIKTTLKTYLNEDGKLDAKSLSNAWFPSVNADVFISHSHNDEEDALRLAGWLKETFGLNAFIDSTVWNSADALIRTIDDSYCKHESKQTYDYNKRNLSTSHVHMMLAMAIGEMIDKCECLFFLTTPSSITPKKTINQGETTSPWIYAEIAISRIIQKKELPTARRDATRFAMDSVSNESVGSVQVVHPLDVAHLVRIGEPQLNNWKNRYNRALHKFPLDVLYKQNPLR